MNTVYIGTHSQAVDSSDNFAIEMTYSMFITMAMNAMPHPIDTHAMATIDQALKATLLVMLIG